MAKTEREKMLANELYLASDPELRRMYWAAQELLYRFNTALPGEEAVRQEVLRSLLGAVGQNCQIMPSFRCDYGCHIFMGDQVFLNYDCVILDCNEVHIGNHVLMASKVQIYTAYHPLEAEVRRSGLEAAAPIVIEDDVWIGGGAIVCPGVTIGKGTTIGAGSVVTKNIPANVVAVGNPCRVIKTLDG